MLGARVFEKQPVVLYGPRRLVGLIVQLCKIVMRRSICGGTVQHVEQRFLGPVELSRAALGEREVYPGVQVTRLQIEGGSELGDGLIRAAQRVQPC